MPLIQKAKNISLLILDVDGVLTDGVVYYGRDDEEVKGFHLHDGLGLKLLLRAGIQVAIISGKKSLAVERRLQELKIKHFYLGHEEKLPAYLELKAKLGLADEQIAYMGDDLPDLCILSRVGLAISVPCAPKVIHDHVHFVTKKPGGHGAVREVCEFILEAQGKYLPMIQSYLAKQSETCDDK